MSFADAYDMSNQLKGLHDRLLRDKPDGATHSADECPLCALESIDNGGQHVDDQPEGGSMSDKTYTFDDLKAAIEAVSEARKTGKSSVTAQAISVSPDVAAIITLIDEMVDDLMDKLGIPDTDDDAGNGDTASLDAANAKIAELEAKLQEGQVSELQKKLDAAVLEAQAAKQAREDLEAKIEADKKAAEEAAALEARKDERLAQVKEVASFSDEHLAANADRWAAMSDDEFAKCIEDWKEIASKYEGEIPKVTSMTASRDEGGNQSQSALSTLRDLRYELTGAKSL